MDEVRSPARLSFHFPSLASYIGMYGMQSVGSPSIFQSTSPLIVVDILQCLLLSLGKLPAPFPRVGHALRALAPEI